MTSPSFPVNVTSPFPSDDVASTCSTSPPTSVHAKPVYQADLALAGDVLFAESDRAKQLLDLFGVDDDT